MFRADSTRKVSRFWAVDLVEDATGKKIHLNVEDPKLKTFREFEKLDKDASIEENARLISVILTKNREHRKISVDFVLENFDLEDMVNFFTSFANWVNTQHSTKN